MYGTNSTMQCQARGGFRGHGLRAGLAIAGLAVLLAGCGQGQPAGSITRASAAPIKAAQATMPAAAASPDVSMLLASARRAYAEHKIVAPAADNAVAYYVAVLGKAPGNRVATDALREIFPYAVADVRASIAHRDVGVAGQEIALLAKADPDNYTVTLLRTELAARQGWTRAPQHPAASTAQATLPAVTGSHVLVMRASADSWVEVAGVDGGEVESGILRAGESRTFHAAGQVKITLGNAQGVTVIADGKPVDVEQFRRGKVAHLVAFNAGVPAQDDRLADRASSGMAASTL